MYQLKNHQNQNLHQKTNQPRKLFQKIKKLQQIKSPIIFLTKNKNVIIPQIPVMIRVMKKF